MTKPKPLHLHRKRQPGTDDPRFLLRQIAFRVPWFYERQLLERAEKADLSLPQFVEACCYKVVPPEAPKDRGAVTR